MKNSIDMNMDMVLISIYNAQADEKIYVNDKDFFINTFESPYDAAQAVSLSGQWRWTDDYVFFNNEGYITSFNHWDDKNSPINIDKLDICQLINSLKNFRNKQGCVVNNISRAIHDALK